VKLPERAAKRKDSRPVTVSLSCHPSLLSFSFILISFSFVLLSSLKSRSIRSCDAAVRVSSECGVRTSGKLVVVAARGELGGAAARGSPGGQRGRWRRHRGRVRVERPGRQRGKMQVQRRWSASTVGHQIRHQPTLNCDGGMRHPHRY